jgi:hypothetical protein
MFTIITKLLIKTLGNPLFWVIILTGTLIIGLMNRDQFTDTAVSQQARIEQLLTDWQKEDPEVKRIQAQVNNDLALAIAYQSSLEDANSRSTQHSMVDEWRENEAVPYRARLAALALDDRELRRTPDLAEAFFLAHGTTCEFLGQATGVTSIHDYLTLLEQAKANPDAWPLVRDDPIALQVWANAEGLEEVKFYRKNRDWLADPLVALDYNNSTITGPAEVIRKIAKFPNTVRLALSPDEEDLGVVGLMALLSHGELIDLCREDYGIPPQQTIAVLFMNPDIFDTPEGDRAWVRQQASWLNDIEKHSPTVWLAAMEFPFTLRLHIDAPHISEELLSKYGADQPQLLLYDLFQNEDGTYDQQVIIRAAESVNAFGDLGIYVFAKYRDPIWRTRLERFLRNDEIGVRLIPFMVRFGDEGFDKIEDNSAWLDKYFAKDGSPIVDPTEWVTYIPGGSVYKVAENWTKGIPNEGSELGWAIVDVGDIALTVATFGASKAVTTSAKAGRAINKGADLARAGSKATKIERAERTMRWSERLAGKVNESKSLKQMVSLANKSKVTRALKNFTWDGIKISTDTTEFVSRHTKGVKFKGHPHI